MEWDKGLGLRVSDGVIPVCRENNMPPCRFALDSQGFRLSRSSPGLRFNP